MLHTWSLPSPTQHRGRERHLASVDDAEGLGAEDALAGEGQQGRIHGDGQLHGQLRRDDAGDDHRAVQEQLEPVAVLVLHNGAF